MIYSICVFARGKKCLYYEEFNVTRKSDKKALKNLFGLLFEMKRFIIKTSPTS